ncbi:MAG TPA: IS110 family transposase [Dermatophilaceae bacterium]|nr:IS110 family transposase [Dermatophilaceae bacterium]
MSATIIGVDPHKRSQTTAVVLDDAEQIASKLRVTAGAGQVDELLGWALDQERVWAIENANGLGRLLAQQLVARDEAVIDVPATLSSRARKLSGHSGRKTDEHDARSVVIAAAHNSRLRRVSVENNTVVLGLLLDRRWHLVAQRQRTLCQLHVLLAELVPAGAAMHLTSKKAAVMLRKIAPGGVVELERKLLARELLEDVRWLDRRIPVAMQRLSQALTAYGTTLTDIHGIGEIGAATILSIVDDPARFPDPGHFAAFNGTAPLEASSGDVRRHRLSRRGNRQLNKVLHVAARTQIRRGGPGRTYYDRKLAEGKSKMEALRALKRQLSDVIYRRLLADARQRQAARGGQTGTRPKSA